MFLLEERTGIEVIDTLTIQATVDGEPTRPCFSEDMALGWVALLRTSQTLGMGIFEQPLLTLLIIQQVGNRKYHLYTLTTHFLRT
jgi:hypothetical protein